jgi:dihydrofolate reductase
MRKLIYSMSVSLDGYVAGPDGDFAWSAPDDELHRFHNHRVRELDMQLLGRHLYEAMLSWETTPEDDSVGGEFARIWKRLPRIVFSRTLQQVEGNATLASAGVAEEVARLKEQPGRDIGIGGAGLASECARLGLIDEYQPFVCPVVVGGGTPYLPPLDEQIELELLETRTFASRVVYLRYAARR